MVWAILMGVSVLFWANQGREYRKLHETLSATSISDVQFSRFPGYSFHLSDDQKEAFIGLYRDFALIGYMTDLRSQCYLTVTTGGNESIYYHLQLDPLRRKARISIQGSKEHGIAGFSMGAYEEAGSRIYQWIQREKIFEVSLDKLPYCGQK